MKLAKEQQRNIEMAVNEMLARIGMEYPKNSLLEIIKELNIIAYLVDFKEHADKVSGIIDKRTIPAKIYLNKRHPKTRQTFTLAHEIGHFILHDNSINYRVDTYLYTDEKAKEENEANYFAACLLVPKYKLLELLEKTSDLSTIADYFGVSPAVIAIRQNWIETN
jgi:Zn-dependent peptidase ImmA (M78 family)